MICKFLFKPGRDVFGFTYKPNAARPFCAISMDVFSIKV
ncbi:hypothetical protein CHCC20335_3758 [Bacillus paralicheniformis]|nr:hypothetical protein CHCC20335_3758 [Bacillus paralicheniformis]